MKKLAQSPASPIIYKLFFLALKYQVCKAFETVVVHLSFWRTEETQAQMDEISSHFT